MTLSLQSKILRAIEEGEIDRPHEPASQAVATTRPYATRTIIVHQAGA